MNFYSFKYNHSYDNDRITLTVSNKKACELTIKKLTLEDNGEWKFVTQFYPNKTTKIYTHRIELRHNREYDFNRRLIRG